MVAGGGVGVRGWVVVAPCSVFGRVWVVASAREAREGAGLKGWGWGLVARLCFWGIAGCEGGLLFGCESGVGDGFSHVYFL